MMRPGLGVEDRDRVAIFIDHQAHDRHGCATVDGLTRAPHRTSKANDQEQARAGFMSGSFRSAATMRREL